ncbi:unnamed protein product [Trifolium pratense]|uniref:Uncharacterized protein n=1 Tax=Trifolium pratense TaxID=57577 RepID=A0ACB0JUU0_TRIPR|nr:unnamed protein product [Trifolium pratense]
MQIVYGSLPFDLEAGHKILPNIIPWSFASELSTLIEKEVAKSMTIIENNSNWEGLANEELCIETDYLAILDSTYVVWLLCSQFSYVNILVANLLRCTIYFMKTILYRRNCRF